MIRASDRSARRQVSVQDDRAHERKARKGGTAAHLFAIAAEHEAALTQAVCSGDRAVHEADRFVFAAARGTRDARQRQRDVTVEGEPRAKSTAGTPSKAIFASFA